MNGKSLSAGNLKWIALFTMLLDHIGAAVIGPLYVADYFVNDELWYQIYMVLRTIGRSAFPIYCFLLVEGYIHTRNRMRYGITLFIFGLLSEIPFDLAFDTDFYNITDNVFYTLLLGLTALSLGDILYRKWRSHQADTWENAIGDIKELLCKVVVGVPIAYLAYLLGTDYSYKGILLIMVLHYFRNNRYLQCIMGYLSFIWYSFSFPAFVCMRFYNGRRGKQFKYFFYLFYPAHLLILYWIRIAIYHK